MNVTPEISEGSASPIATVADAEQLAGHLNGVMDALVRLVEEETELVRAGKLRDATRLEADKNDLARLYVTDTRLIQASQSYLASAAPDLMRRLDFVRAAKTPYELECMRAANRLGALGHKAAAQAFQAGATEFEIELAFLRPA